MARRHIVWFPPAKVLPSPPVSQRCVDAALRRRAPFEKARRRRDLREIRPLLVQRKPPADRRELLLPEAGEHDDHRQGRAAPLRTSLPPCPPHEIGRASCRERA